MEQSSKFLICSWFFLIFLQVESNETRFSSRFHRNSSWKLGFSKSPSGNRNKKKHIEKLFKGKTCSAFFCFFFSVNVSGFFLWRACQNVQSRTLKKCSIKRSILWTWTINFNRDTLTIGLLTMSEHQLINQAAKVMRTDLRGCNLLAVETKVQKMKPKHFGGGCRRSIIVSPHCIARQIRFPSLFASRKTLAEFLFSL